MMKKDLIKRGLALLLSIVLLMGNVPVAAFATDEELPAATETVVPEETSAPTVAPTEAPAAETEAPTEAPVPEETSAPTVPATEPVVQETVAPTEPPVPEETVAPTEAPVEIVASDWITVAPDPGLPDNQELYEGYLDQVFYGGRATFGTAAGRRLTGDEKTIYDALVPIMKKIANGERTSTVIGIGQTFTDGEGTVHTADVNASFAGTSFERESMGRVIDALLSDLPFEMYWYDKTSGSAYIYWLSTTVLYIEISFQVSDAYQGSGETTVNTAKTGTAATAASKANAIVSKYAGASDYEKLVGYRNEICNLVSYDYAAAGSGNFKLDNNPWQLINVFDGDTATNVVCEGYSKAFAYLCDQTAFSGDVSCYLATGTMNGGGHMWNIVTLEGKNYLVDVTNSDSGTVGQDGKLFLAGGSGSMSAGYTVGGVKFVYDGNTTSTWGTATDSILNLSDTKYVAAPELPGGSCGTNAKWTFDEATGCLTISGTGALGTYSSGTNPAPWYDYIGAIKTVIIKDGITDLGKSAFYNCEALTDVSIPGSVTDLGSYTFGNCVRLTGIDLPSGITSIEDGVFSGCSALTDAQIPVGVTSIGYSAFGSCSSLETVTFPEGLVSIGQHAFDGCVLLETLSFPDGLKTIDYGAFMNCDGLTEIVLPDACTGPATLSFGYCDNLAKVTLGKSCGALSSAFGYCPKLVSLTLPENVTSLGVNALYGCSAFTTLTFTGNAPQSVNTPIFHSAANITIRYPGLNATWPDFIEKNTNSLTPPYGGTLTWESYAPDGVQYGSCGENLIWVLDEADGKLTISGTGAMDDYAYKTPAPWNEYASRITDVTIGSGVTQIGDQAFTGCSSLTEITIPDNVTSLGDFVFSKCTGLTKVTLGSGLTQIPSAAFYKCSSLVDLDIPANIKTIGANAFQDCTALRTIYIPATVTGMPNSSGSSAFYGCDESLAIYCGHEAAPSSWGNWNGAFSVSYGYTKDEFDYWTGFDPEASSVRIAEGITRIPSMAFHNFTNLETVYIPDSVTAIGSNAFAGCTGLKNIYIPAGVTAISAQKYDAAPFYGCDDSLQVYFGAAQELDSWDYYWDCYASSTHHIKKHFGYTRAEYDYWMNVDKTVSSLVIPEGITRIPDYFFCGREYIGDTPMFGSNTTLRSITIPASVKTIGEYAFECCEALTTVKIADGVQSIGEGAFLGCTGLRSISIPASVKLVDFYAFDECANLIVKYAGTMLEWAEVSESRINAVCSDGTIVDYGSCGIGVSWMMDSNYTLTVFGNGYMTNYDYYWNVPWYSYTDYITKVNVLEGIASVGALAFYDCPKLTTVALPETLVRIEAYAFYGCTALKSVTIPRSVNYIGVEAFYYNKELATVLFRQGSNDDLVIDIGAFMMLDRNKATTVKVPDKTAINPAISGYDWSGNLRKVTYASHNCEGKHYIVYENAVDATCTTDGSTGSSYCEVCNAVLSANTVIPAPGHKEIVEPGYAATCLAAGLTDRKYCSVCSEVLAEHTEIEALGHANVIDAEVAATCTEDGLSEGSHCERCGTVEVAQQIVPAFGHSKDENHKCVTCGEIGGACGEKVTWAFDEATGLLIVSGEGAMADYELGDAPWYAFSDHIKFVKIENGVTTVGDSAFRRCENVTGVEIPESVTNIGMYAFFQCFKLESITLPSNLQSIGDSAFRECMALVNIQVPASVTHIGSAALAAGYDLVGIWVDGENPAYCSDENGVLFSKDKRTLVQMSNSRKGTYVIPDGVTTIGSAAFRYNDGLTNIKIPNSVNMIESGAFVFCLALQEIVIPDSVNRINAFTFQYCWNLTSVVVPASVIGFDKYAFTDCAAMHDLYYAGTEEQWNALDANLSDEVFVHFECAAYLEHWESETIFATCVETGKIRETCACGYERFKESGEAAKGHVAVVDAAVAPTCTETGLTEGSHCATCGEIYVIQEVIPATGHAFEVQNGAIVCPNCGMEMYVRIAQDYLAMDLQVLTEAQLAYELSHEDLEDRVTWSIEGEEGIVEIDENGFVTAVGEGAVHAVATLTYQVSEDSKLEVSAHCRIDVTAEPQIEGVQLSAATLTTQLYSTDYTTFEVLLQLPQNYYREETSTYGLRGGRGVMMENAYFTNTAMAELFDLVILDDRTVQIVPKIDEDITNPAEVKTKYGSVKSKYEGTIKVSVLGEEYETPKVILNVKKTLPKLKATVPAFNSFYMGQSRNITITGATATEIYADESKNTATKPAMPVWVEFGEELGQLTLKADAPLKSVSGSAYLAVKTEEYRVPVAVTLSVKNTYKTPALKLSASSVTMTTLTDASNGAALKLLPTAKNTTLADLNVADITADKGFSVENFKVEDGSFVLRAPEGFASGTVTLTVSFDEEITAVTVKLELSVRTAKVALKLAKTSLTLNKNASDYAEVALTATPADFALVDPEIRITGTAMVDGKKQTVDKTDSGELSVGYADGKLYISTTPETPEKDSYKVNISAGGSKTTLTVNVISAVPTVTYKATGNVDLTFPEKTATITPTFKNYNGDIAAYTYTVAEMKGSTVVNSDVTNAFAVENIGKTFHVRCVDEQAVNTSNTYKVTLSLVLSDGTQVSNTASLKVKRTSVSLKLSPTKLSLNKTVGDVGTVNVTCGTKGYTVTDPIIQVMDSTGKVSAEGKLKVTYENGKLIVNQTEDTAYGATYKVLVRANSYAPAVTLTVTVPTREKSNITATLNTKGSIDVIRDGSALTVTPVYKNVIDGKRLEEKLIFTKTVKTVTEDATDLFFYTENADGSFTVTKRDGAELDHSAKYSVQLVAYNGEEKVCETKPKAITVKMGTAKLTVASQSATLFAKDRNDRVVFWFDTTDTALNGIAEVKIKEATNEKLFEIIPYGDGIYAIAFKDKKVDSSFLTQKSASKAVTVTLNVTLDGNETAKVNAALKLKLTVVK